MTGTVTAIDTGVREVRVISGIGHAVRVMLFHAGPDCEIRVGGAEAPLRDVTRGAIVVVRYRQAPGRLEAERLDARSPPPQTSER